MRMAREGIYPMKLESRRCAALLIAAIAFAAAPLLAQEAKPKPEDTEVWSPEPKVVTPGATCDAAPSDAIILFDGKNADEWVMANQDHGPAQWDVHDGMMTVKKGSGSGNIETKRKFKNYQLHVEWRIHQNIT